MTSLLNILNMPILRMPGKQKTITSSKASLLQLPCFFVEVEKWEFFFPRRGMSWSICWRVPATFPDSLPPASHNQRHAAKRARNLREGPSPPLPSMDDIFGAANVKFPKNVTRISAFDLNCGIW